MIFALKKKLFIPRPIVQMFVRLCKFYSCKRPLQKKYMVVRPLLSRDINIRVQIDLIDLESTTDESFKWLLNYQDHAPKFIQLRPLKSKRAT